MGLRRSHQDDRIPRRNTLCRTRQARRRQGADRSVLLSHRTGKARRRSPQTLIPRMPRKRKALVQRRTRLIDKARVDKRRAFSKLCGESRLVDGRRAWAHVGRCTRARGEQERDQGVSHPSTLAPARAIASPYRTRATSAAVSASARAYKYITSAGSGLCSGDHENQCPSSCNVTRRKFGPGSR